MLQLTYAVVFAVIAGTLVLWWVILYKLLPLYRVGAIAGPYRGLYLFAAYALSWVTAQIFPALMGRGDAGAALLGVLWAVGGLSWLLVATVRRTRRNVFEARTQAAGGSTSGAAGGYTVRTQPRPVAATTTGRGAFVPAHDGVTGRSARSQRILRGVEL